jgi:glycosyltransferase involved in cell wall biosynthesis
MISVLILTFNEENNLPRCLAAVKWADDIVVLDSFSTDRTVEIAKAAGARVYQRLYDNESSQRSFSLREISYKHSWVYNPDADEEPTPALCEEMFAAVQHSNAPAVAYRMRFRTMFMGRWIRFSSLYPTWVVRLFRPEKVHFERSTNLTYVCDGIEGQLQGHFIHYTFNNGFDAWFAKHNAYSHFEAIETFRSLSGPYSRWSDLIAPKGIADRRRALKELSFRVPFRPTLRFMYMYLVRGGILDGKAGLTYCRLLAIYEYLIVLKVAELRRRQLGLPV